MASRTRRQLASVLNTISPLLPVPWDIDTFVRRLAKNRGRRIVVVPWQFPAGESSGLWIPTKKADYIFYAEDATPSRREQIIGHELGHVLLDHTPALDEAPQELLASLAPTLGPDLARRMLARSGYDPPHEAEAEAFGTRLARAGRAKRPRGPDDELGRLTDALR